MKWEVLIKHVCYMLKFKGFLQDIVMGLFELPAELARIFFFFHETPYLLGRLSDGKLRSLSLSGRRSLRNEQPQPVASRKSIGNFYCRYYKVQSLKRKLRFWKTRICHWDLNSFPISKDFPDKLGGEIVNVIFFKITYHKMR